MGGGGDSLSARKEVDSIEDVHMAYESVGCAAGSKSDRDQMALIVKGREGVVVS